MTRTRSWINPAIAFPAAALAVISISAAIVRSRLFHANPDVLAWAVTFDLTITIPAIYWFAVVRTGRARPLTIAPVFVIAASIAAILVPARQQMFLHQLRFFAAPLDVITIGLIVRKILQLRGSSGGDDAETRIRRAAASIFGSGVVADAVATEIAICWYALFCWTRGTAVPRDARAVTVHERSGWGSVVVCILVLIASESLGTHLLLSLWSAKAAWVATALDAYGILWLIGDYHALRLRPTLVRAGSIELRHGLRWSATIDRANIAAVERVGRDDQWKRRATLKLALLDEPQFLVTLREPVIAHGLMGLRRTVDSIAIRPDDAEAFLDALR